MKRRPVLRHLKEWWWLYGVASALCGAIVLWGGLPSRVAKAEEQIDDLRGWAKEIQGYTRAMNQQVPNQARPPQVPIRRNWDELQQRYWCDDGSQQWWANQDGTCE